MDIEEIQSEATEPMGTIKATLGGEPMLVKPPKKWKTRAIRSLNSGDFDAWAETSLVEGYYDVWLDVDPDMEQVEAFFLEFNENSGDAVGKSSKSGPRLKSIPRR